LDLEFERKEIETSAIKSVHGEAIYNSERQLLGEMEAWGMCRFATN